MRSDLIKNVTLVLALAGLVLAMSQGSTQAQSRVCAQLEHQLASVSTGNGVRPSRKYRQYDRAVKEQKRQYTKTQRIAKRSGCRRDSGARSGRCGRLSTSLRRMRANLASLENTRNRLRPNAGNSSAQRRSIMRKLKRRGCLNRDIRGARLDETTPRRRSLVEQVFGVRTYNDDGRGNGVEIGSRGSNSNTFRTLCVRTCDGYYFPISFSTTREHFSGDQETCSAMCPGSEAKLFFHAMPSEAAEQMISYGEETPYSEQPYAFSYRKSVSSQCQCRFKESGLRELAGSTDKNSGSGEVKKREIFARIGIPVYRQDPYIDPESAANKSGSFTMATLKKLANRPDEKESEQIAKVSNGRKIRIVGPAFFPVQ